MPKEARIGWWMFEWWWNQPNVPHVAEFVAEFRKAPAARCRPRATGSATSRSTPFALAAEKAKSLDAVKLAQALEDMELPPEVALQPNKVYYRKGDHQLMSDLFVGEVQSAGRGDPDDLFTVDVRGPRRQAPARSETGCTLQWPPDRRPSRRDTRPDTIRAGAMRALSADISPRSGERRAMLQLVLFNVTNGLIIGAFYVLMALGLSLILNLSNVINFAHGNFLAIGGYIAFMLTPYIGFWGALLVSPLLTALIGHR